MPETGPGKEATEQAGEAPLGLMVCAWGSAVLLILKLRSTPPSLQIRLGQTRAKMPKKPTLLVLLTCLLLPYAVGSVFASALTGLSVGRKEERAHTGK